MLQNMSKYLWNIDCTICQTNRKMSSLQLNCKRFKNKKKICQFSMHNTLFIFKYRGSSTLQTYRNSKPFYSKYFFKLPLNLTIKVKRQCVKIWPYLTNFAYVLCINVSKMLTYWWVLSKVF